jgi:integrase
MLAMPKHAARKADTVFRNAKAQAKPYQISDGGGLSLQIQANGSKLWIFRYRRPDTGKQNSMSLGPYPDTTPAQARELAADKRVKVREGIDPVQVRREAKVTIRREADGKFPSAAAAWLETRQKSVAKTTYTRECIIVNDYLIPGLGRENIRSLATAQAAIVLRAMFEKVPSMALKARHTLNAIVAYSCMNGLREDGKILMLRGVFPNTYTGGNLPAITQGKSIETKIGKLARAIDAYSGSLITRSTLQICMLTALRPGVVASAPWAEIDLDAAEWHIPGSRMKMNRPHSVSLPKQAVAILRGMHALSGHGTWVFPSPQKQQTAHIGRDALSNALRNMGFSGEHTTHGFRAMLRTVGREHCNMDIDVLEAQLAHAKKGQVQKAYDRTTFGPQRRKVMQEWADFIDKCRKGAKVSQLANA